MWRLIDTGFNNAFMNMAIDEALLTSKIPVLRFYGWKPAGLSIGYFQSIKSFNFENLKKHKIDLVRRLTGGNAVLHDKELTYSVIIDEKEMPKSIIESYKVISKGLLQGLKNLGLNAVMNEYVEKGEKSAVCFNDTSWYEIIVNGKKIVGSAQKRINGKILQHGAVLIDADVEKYCSLFNNCNPELIEKVKQRMTSINEELKNFACIGFDGFSQSEKPCSASRREQPLPRLTNAKFFNKKVDYQMVKQAMKNGFEKALGIEFEVSRLTKEEKKLAERLEKEKYKTKRWNSKY